LGIAQYEDIPLFYVTINKNKWYFTNQTDQGGYYYLNNYGKLDKIIKAPGALFSGYEGYASGRGYIWSRTLPLLKKHIILGSGADTFMISFPQDDYVGLYNHGYSDQLMTKPHNLYLQIGVQTGVLSLIAFLVFYAMYFISSVKLYIKGRYKSYYARVGVAILVASVSYIVLGLANDSSLTVAPVFWVLIGLGITVNRLAKPYIEEETI
ncbi:MAG: O-antigen ligase domain-containing protein, partial [Anaerolineaceae bacterium]